MQSMKNVFPLKVISVLALVALLVMSSCEDRLNFATRDTDNVENEAATDGYFEDTDDMSAMAIAADNGTMDGSRESAGRAISKAKLDARFACESTVVTLIFAGDNTQHTPHGTITIDFGTGGCTDARGNVRRGKIVSEFKGRRFLPGSSVVTTLVDYSINGIILEGVRTVTNNTVSTETAPNFDIQLENGKATWPDGTSATREVSRTREWIRATNPLMDEWRVTGTAAGTNRNNTDYTMTITKTLVFKRECAINARVFMPVEGTKELTADAKKVTIDYGSGECDRKVNITINGRSKEVEVRGDI
jgi:hypothetical protein